MKTTITSLFVAIMLLISGSMKAQFSDTLVDEPRSSWCEGPDVTFKLSEVAAQMQVTVTQLVDAFDEWTANANGDSNGYELTGFFMLENSNTTPTFHSEQYGGFEMDQEGNFSSWNGGAYWGVYIHYMDVETDELAMVICQNPTNPLQNGQVCHGTVSINLNGGQATFDLTFSVDAGEPIDKEAQTDLNKLTIVGEAYVECVQEQNDQWWSYEYTIPTTGIAEKLDIDPEYMAKMFRQMVFAKNYDSNNEQWGELSNEGDATPSPGFYFSGGIIHIDPETEAEYEEMECRNAEYMDGNLFWGMYVGNTRTYYDGMPEGGWNPQEDLPMEDMIDMFTSGAAYAEHREDELGTLEAGKLADITVSDRNLLKLAGDTAIRDTKVLLTMVDGRIVYEN